MWAQLQATLGKCRYSTVRQGMRGAAPERMFALCTLTCTQEVITMVFPQVAPRMLHDAMVHMGQSASSKARR